jgi:hypothetical protein
MWNGIEKRRFPRAEYPCRVRVRKPSKKGVLRKKILEEFVTHTENIGSGGICVILEKGLGLFTPVEVDIDLGNGKQWVTANGTIVWVVRRTNLPEKKQFDTGIEFVNLKDPDR